MIQDLSAMGERMAPMIDAGVTDFNLAPSAAEDVAETEEAFHAIVSEFRKSRRKVPKLDFQSKHTEHADGCWNFCVLDSQRHGVRMRASDLQLNELALRKLACGYAFGLDNVDPMRFADVFLPDGKLTIIFARSELPPSQMIGRDMLLQTPAKLSGYDKTMHFLGQSEYGIEGWICNRTCVLSLPTTCR